MSSVVPRSYFDRRAEVVAPELLGRVLRHRDVAVRLTEVEAYAGADDPAAHSFRGKTRRNAVMFGPPGHLYVYFTYGMHFCANLVCLPDGTAGAVLLRAGEVIEGEESVRARKPPGTAHRDLARGPARLCVALGLAREHNGLDCCSPEGELRLLEGDPAAPASVRSGPRTGVANGAETPWRFWIDGDPSVSPYRRHVPRRRSRRAESSGDPYT